MLDDADIAFDWSNLERAFLGLLLSNVLQRISKFCLAVTRCLMIALCVELTFVVRWCCGGARGVIFDRSSEKCLAFCGVTE